MARITSYLEVIDPVTARMFIESALEEERLGWTHKKLEEHALGCWGWRKGLHPGSPDSSLQDMHLRGAVGAGWVLLVLRGLL